MDFILHCGDISHHGAVADYAEVKAYFECFFPKVPLLVTPGNHDSVSPMNQVFTTKEESVFGFVRQFPQLQVISLDSSHQENGKLSEKQAVWLLDKLTNDLNKPSILFTHHHFFQEQSCMPCADVVPEFYEVLKHSSLKGIFTGHTHYFYHRDLCGVPYFAADSFSFQGTDSGEGYLEMKESSAYHLFSYENEKIHLEEKGDLGFHKRLPITRF